MSILAYILHLLMGEPLKTQRCLRKTIGVVNIEPVVAFLPSSIHFYLLSPLWTRMMKNEGYKKCLTEKCRKDLPLKMKSSLAYYFSFSSPPFEPIFSHCSIFFFSCTSITCGDVGYYFSSSHRRALCLCSTDALIWALPRAETEKHYWLRAYCLNDYKLWQILSSWVSTSMTIVI